MGSKDDFMRAAREALDEANARYGPPTGSAPPPARPAPAAPEEPRPAACTEAMLEYLDELRDSGVTNMFGARPYVREAFPELTDAEAGAVLRYWMRTYGARHPQQA